MTNTIQLITLENFLLFYVFRDDKLDKITGNQNSQIVRIYYDEDDANHWFEFGISDYATIPDPLDKIITQEILNKIVVGFYTMNNKLCITVVTSQLSAKNDNIDEDLINDLTKDKDADA